MLAEGLGLHDEALRWAARTNLANFDLGMHAMMSPYRVAAHVREARLADALEECWSAYGGATSKTTDERELQLRMHTGKISAVTIGFALANLRISSGRTAAEQAATMLEIELRRLTVSDLDPFWAAFVEVTRYIATGDRNSRTLYEAGLQWENRSETQIGIMYRIAAIMSAAPQEAFHLTMCSFRRKLIPWVGETPYASVTVPFLRSYWRWAVENYSFHFSSPARSVDEVENALLVPGEPGIRQALAVIARTLRINLTDSYRQYLAEVDSNRTSGDMREDEPTDTPPRG